MLTRIRALSRHALDLLRSLAWAGPLLVRLTVGLVFVSTGWGKLHSLDDVTQYFESLHIPAPGAQAALVSCIEFGGGLLLVAGLGTRVVSALLIGVMAVAIWTAKLPDLHGVLDLVNTIELTYLVIFVWLVLSGAGTASLDHVLVRRSRTSARVGAAA